MCVTQGDHEVTAVYLLSLSQVTGRSGTIPVILVEVKSSVGSILGCVDVQHLGQILIQGYYAMSYAVNNIIVTITDNATWHFFWNP